MTIQIQLTAVYKDGTQNRNVVATLPCEESANSWLNTNAEIYRTCPDVATLEHQEDSLYVHFNHYIQTDYFIYEKLT